VIPVVEPVGAQDGRARAVLTRLKNMSRFELASLCFILASAFVLRVWDLTTVPPGLHGDEGVTGLEGIRFLEEGHIGVYTGSALGQPTAPFYVSGLSIAIFGKSVFAIRIVSVLAGVLTVAATYLVSRRRYGNVSALGAAAVLTVMVWHLNFSRIAFGVIWWPLVTLAAVALIDRAIVSGEIRLWVAAGAATSFGVYVYNSHWLAGLAIAFYLAGWSLVNRRDVLAGRWRELVAFGASAMLILLPMLRYINDDSNDYGAHIRTISLRSTDAWSGASFAGKVRLLADGYGHAVDVLLFRPAVDFGDGTGTDRPVQLVVVFAAVMGIGAILRRPTVFGKLLVLVVVVLPLAPALTVNGEIRRDFAAAPLLAILAGLGLSTGFAWVRARKPALGWIVAVFVVWQLLVPVPRFFEENDHPSRAWVFADELTQPVAIAESLQDEVFINFYSRRHSMNYESIQFLAPDLVGTNRSNEFSEQPGIALVNSAGRDNLFVLIGDYVDFLPALQSTYTDGEIVASGLSGGVPYEIFRTDATT
jgi:4-amino-4-deoxy-L-arabinose transferase-like glycosyltransferase